VGLLFEQRRKSQKYSNFRELKNSGAHWRSLFMNENVILYMNTLTYMLGANLAHFGALSTS